MIVLTSEKRFLPYPLALANLEVKPKVTPSMVLLVVNVDHLADYRGEDDENGFCYIHRSLSELSRDTGLPETTVSDAMMRLEAADLLRVDRSGVRNRRKNDRTAWLTINYARMRELGIDMRPDHETAARQNFARAMRKANQKNLDSQLADLCAAQHIPEVSAVHFVDQYGKDMVLEKLRLLQDEVRSGHEIHSPAGWLQAALAKNYETTKSREAKHKKARKEEGERRAKQLEERFAREDEEKRAARRKDHQPEESSFWSHLPPDVRDRMLSSKAPIFEEELEPQLFGKSPESLPRGMQAGIGPLGNPPEPLQPETPPDAPAE